MTDIDYPGLKKKLIYLLKEYLKDPKNPALKEHAQLMNSAFRQAGPLMPKSMEEAVDTMLSIGVDELESPSVSEITRLISTLEKLEI